jgi:hypothetical protein
MPVFCVLSYCKSYGYMRERSEYQQKPMLDQYINHQPYVPHKGQHIPHRRKQVIQIGLYSGW